MPGYAWVTLATNDSYGLGALVLAESLKSAAVNTQAQTVVLVTDTVTAPMLELLQKSFTVVKTVNLIESEDFAKLALIKRPELYVTLTKLNAWKLTEYEKCVFLDADTLVLQNCDELFEHNELSASPDPGWPDIFNSGMFVFKPSDETYEKLVKSMIDNGSFDGADQGLLNLFFRNWNRLPFTYNTSISAVYSYLPAFLQFEKDIKILHFLGKSKPWTLNYDPATKKITSLPKEFESVQKYLELWWIVFTEKVYSNLSVEMGGAAAAIVQKLSGSAQPDPTRWERGEMDYMGVDSFANILAQIQATLTSGPSSSAPEADSAPKPAQTATASTTEPVAAKAAPKAAAPAPAPAKSATQAPSSPKKTAPAAPQRKKK